MYKKRTLKTGRLFFVSCLICVGIFPSPGLSAIRKITTNGFNNTNPSLYNGTIAWQSNVDGDWEIYYWDGLKTIKITDNSSISDSNPSLYAGKIAWQSDYSIVYWDGVTVREIAANGDNPDLDSGTIAWNSSSGILFWDGAVTRQISDNRSDKSPSLSGGQIAWIGNYDGDNDVYYWDGVSVYKKTNTYTYEYSVSLHNGKIAWGSSYGLYYWNGFTTQLITTDYISSLSLHNGKIAWSHSGDIFYWDGTRIYRITNYGNADADNPSLYDGEIAFVSNIDGGNQIYYWDGNNDKPIADAGKDQKVKEGCYLELDGSGSRDPDGFIDFWEWQLNGLTIGSGENIEVSCPDGIGAHVITLTVTDNFGQTSTDTMVVDVQPFYLKASAGRDQTVKYGSTVILIGNSNLSEIDCEEPWAYEWEIKSRTRNYSVESRGENPFQFNWLPIGIYDATLTVTDWCSREPQTATDSMILKVVEKLPESHLMQMSPIYLLLLSE